MGKTIFRAIAIVFILMPGDAYPATIHVPGDYQTIQAAIDAAGDGDTILIANGTYSGTGNIGIEWDATVKHLVIMSEYGRDHCIIDCKEEDRGFLLNNGQDHRDVIDGLTITNGSVLGAGGAIHISSTSPTIRNCMLVNNIAEGYHDNSYSGGGGAIMIYNVSAPLIQGNIIGNNNASNLGGGLLFAEGASGVLENNIIQGNKALDDWGGGIALWNSSSPLIINNLIINNSCSGWNGGRGGGIYLGHSLSILVNNTIAFNSTTGNEYEDGFGGGISISKWSVPVIKNCIIWYNRSGASSMNIYFDPQEWLDISYCNVENDLGHIFDLEPHTNMDAPPEFVDTINGDYQLLWNSPCINKGNPDTTGLHLPPLDLSGNMRIFEDTVDMGAYEFNQPSSKLAITAGGDFYLYPNPSSGMLFLENTAVKTRDVLVVRIYNVRGELVLEEYLETSKTKFPINISKQPDGIYVIVVLSNIQVLYQQKIVKE
jgi:parallel beta-helix repeat protein